MSLHFVIVHLLLVVFFCVQLCSFCFVVNDSLFWLLKALSMKNYAYEYTQNIGRLFLSFAWMNSRLQMKSANAYLAGNIRKRKCRKVAVGHDSEMRLKRVSVQKCSFFRINAGRERSPKCECPSHSPDILEACFPHGTPVFELDFLWVIYAVQNVIWFLVWGLLCANAQALYCFAGFTLEGLLYSLWFGMLLFGRCTQLFFIFKIAPSHSLKFYWLLTLFFFMLPTAPVQAVQFAFPNEPTTSTALDNGVCSTATVLLGLGAAGLRLLKNATGTALQENINALHILDSDDDEFAVASSATQSFAKDKLENGSEVIVVDDDKENVSPNGSLSVEHKSLDSCSGDDDSDFMPNSTKKKNTKAQACARKYSDGAVRTSTEKTTTYTQSLTSGCYTRYYFCCRRANISCEQGGGGDTACQTTSKGSKCAGICWERLFYPFEKSCIIHGLLPCRVFC